MLKNQYWISDAPLRVSMSAATLLGSRLARVSIAAFVLSGVIIVSGCSKSSAPSPDSAASSSALAQASVAAAPADPLVIPEGMLNVVVLRNYAGAAMDFVKKDEFSPAFRDTPLVGRQFKVTVPYDQQNSSLHYAYDAEKGSLSVWVVTASNYHDNPGHPSLNYIILQQDAHDGAPVPMSNAFGATKDVTPVSYRTFGIGNIHEVYMGLVPKMKLNVNIKGFYEYDRLSKAITLPPEAARAGVKDLAMDVEGVVASGVQGHPVICTHAKTTPTITVAYEETWDECVIAAKLTRVVVHSPSLGVVADWSTTPQRGKSKTAP